MCDSDILKIDEESVQSELKVNFYGIVIRITKESAQSELQVMTPNNSLSHQIYTRCTLSVHYVGKVGFIQ